MSPSTTPLPVPPRKRPEPGALPDDPSGAGPSGMLTTEEVARILRVDPSSVRRWRSARPLQGPPFMRLSQRKVLYNSSDLQHWLDQRRTNPGQEAA